MQALVNEYFTAEREGCEMCELCDQPMVQDCAFVILPAK